MQKPSVVRCYPLLLTHCMCGTCVTQDLKHRHNCEPGDIAAGMAALIADARKSNAGPAEAEGKPAIVVISPPQVHETPKCLSWGFKGCGPKSTGTIDAYRALCKDEKIPFVDLGATATVGSDGIHFPPSASEAIGSAVAKAVASALEMDLE